MWFFTSFNGVLAVFWSEISPTSTSLSHRDQITNNLSTFVTITYQPQLTMQTLTNPPPNVNTTSETLHYCIIISVLYRTPYTVRLRYGLNRHKTDTNTDTNKHPVATQRPDTQTPPQTKAVIRFPTSTNVGWHEVVG